MSEYRRFVAYIYEYREGKKAGNAGHIRVDARDGICRLRLLVQIEKQARSYARVYAFTRRDGRLPCVMLGECASPNGLCKMTVTTQAEHFAGSELKFAQICGIYIETEQGGQYISAWDDEAVHPGMLVTKENAQEKNTLDADTSEDGVAKENAHEKDTLNPRTPGEDTREVEAHKKDVLDAAAEITSQELAAKKRGSALSARWQQFRYHYPGISPFGDEEIRQCVEISPKDISFLGNGEWQFGNNLFLRQAHAKYGHLLLGIHENGKFVLGVPGENRDIQDAHLARMFGFPEFKAVNREAEEVFGYWYHFLE